MKNYSFKLIFYAAFLFNTTYIFSQTFYLTGKLTDDSTGIELQGANLILFRGEGDIIQSGTSDVYGKFRLKGLGAGTYSLKLSYVGYKTLIVPVSINNDNVDLGKLKLIPGKMTLEEVKIVGAIPSVQMAGDTTQYNADAFKTMPDATAEDLVEKLPGIVIDNGKVQAQGEDVKEVTVDGRPFMGNDPTAALRTLPAEVIDKIQVFDRKSDQAEFTGFDDAETSKIMNLVTRTNMRNGLFGKQYAGYGDNHNYLTGGNINSFKSKRRITVLGQSNNINQQNFSNEDLLGAVSGSRMGGRAGGGVQGRTGQSGARGGSRPGGGFGGGDESDFLVGQQNGISRVHSLGLNYSEFSGDKFEITGNYFFNFTDNRSLQDRIRHYLNNADSGQVYTENSQGSSKNINHRLNLKLDYSINENNSIIMRPRLTFQQNDGFSDFLGKTLAGSDYINQTKNDNNSNLNACNFSDNLLFRHKFGKFGRTVSLNLNGSYNSNSGNKDLLSETNYYSPPVYFEMLDQKAWLEGNSHSLATSIIFTEPVGDSGQVLLSYRTSFLNNKSDKRTFDFDSLTHEYQSFDTALSNTFNNHYFTQGFGTGYLYRHNRFIINGNVSYQNAKLVNNQVFPENYNLNRNYGDLIFTAGLRYMKSRGQNFMLLYRTSTDPPSLNQLQEVIDNSNPVQLRTGNSRLDQSYKHTFNLRYNSIKAENSRLFFILLNGTITENYIGNNVLIAKRDTLFENNILLKQGSQLTYPVNIGNSWNIRTFITYGIPIKIIKINLNFNFNVNYSKVPGMYNNQEYINNNSGMGIGIVLSSNISDKLDFTLSTQSSYNNVKSSLVSAQNNEYWSQFTKLRFKWLILSKVFIESDINHRYYKGYSSGYNENYVLWSGGAGVKILKNQRGELKATVFDMLGQNKNVSRNVSDFYYEDIHTLSLQRYVMFTFTYNLRKFNGARPTDRERMGMPGQGRPEMGSPWQGRPGRNFPGQNSGEPF